MRSILAGLALAALVGCSEEPTILFADSGRTDVGPRDAFVDSSDVFVPADVEPADVDANEIRDVPPDAEADGASDAEIDAGPGDGGLDAAQDADLDAGHDGDLDAGPDAGPICPLGTTTPNAVCADAGICGNGIRESCTICNGRTGGGLVPFPIDGGVCQSFQEDCDGLDLGGASCSGLGYSAGALRCGTWCGFDSRRCDGCARGAHIRACTHPEIGRTDLRGLAFAASANELALAWIDDGGRVSMRRFRLDLSAIGDVPCLGPRDSNDVAIAATSSGWIVAIASASGVLEIHALDHAGNPRGAPRIFPGFAPILVPRAGSSPLLVWTAGPGVRARASLLADDGRELWGTEIFATAVEPHLGSGTFAGDGFLVAMRTNAGVQVARLELDGRLSGTTTPGTSNSEYPQITWTGHEGRLVWAEFGTLGTMVWARLDARGARIGQPVLLGAIPDYFNPSPVVALGEDTLALLARYTGGTAQASRLDLARFNASGSITSGPFPIDQDPNNAIEYRLLRTASNEIYAAWIGLGFPARIGLARLAP